MMQKLQEIHHMSGELLQEMGQMMQREMPHHIMYRDGGQQPMPNYNQGGNGGVIQRQAFIDPWLY